jgi:O-antigen/teichoic acid export membrane protein
MTNGHPSDEASGTSGPAPSIQVGLWQRVIRGVSRTTSDSVPLRTAVPSMVGLRAASIVVAFASSVLIARVLGPHDKGIYNLVVLLPVLYATILDLGVSNGNFFYLARGELAPKTAYANVVAHVVGTALLVAVPFWLLASGVVASTFSSVPERWLLLAILFLGPLTLHGLMVSGGLLMGTNRPTATFLIPLAVQLLVLIGAVVVAVTGVRLTGMILAFTLVTGAGQVLYVVAYHRGGAPGLSVSAAALARSARFGAPLYLATVLSFLHSRADQLVIGGTLPPNELGQYALAVGIAELLWSIDLPVTSAVQYEIARRGPEEATELVHRVSRAIILVMGTACALAAVASPWVIPFVYGASFRAAVTPFLAYLPGVLFWSAARAAGLAIGYQRKRTDLVLYANAAGLALNLILLLLLLRPLGIVGASLASSGSYFLMFCVVAAFHCRLARARPKELLLPRREDAAWLFLLLQGYARSLIIRIRGRSARH